MKSALVRTITRIERWLDALSKRSPKSRCTWGSSAGSSGDVSAVQAGAPTETATAMHETSTSVEPMFSNRKECLFQACR